MKKGTRGLIRQEYEQQHDRGWQVDSGRKKKKEMLSEWVVFGTGMWKLVRIKIFSLFNKSFTGKNRNKHLKTTPSPHHNLVRNWIFKAKTKSFPAS